MKIITSLRIIITLLAIAAFTLILKSCKKVDNPQPVSPETYNNVKAKVIKSIQEKYGQVGSAQIITVNKDVKDLFYRNSSGNMEKINPASATFGPNSPTSPCNYNCSNTTNPANLHLVYTLQSIQRTYYCQTNSFGYLNDVSVVWQISVPFTPLLADPGNPSNLSAGAIVITPPAGPSPASNTLPITISYLGADPFCSANSLYKISYTFQNVILDQVFDYAYPIDTYLTLYNDCGILSNLITTSTVSTTLSNMTAPRDRTEKVWINQNSGPANCCTAAGDYITSCTPPGGVAIDNHQIEYRAVTTTNNHFGWEEQTSTVYYGYSLATSSYYATIDPSTGISYLDQMVPSTGFWLVRYRNIKGTTCQRIGSATSPYPLQTWPGNWAVEVWNL